MMLHSFTLRALPIIAAIGLLGLMPACSSNKADGAGPIQNITETDQRRLAKLNEQELYQRARRALDTGAWDSALALYNDIELRYPFSESARQAQLESLYAYYSLYQEDMVVTLANQFITQYPRHPNADYAHYMKGLANFRRATLDVDSWFRPDHTLRDPGQARESFFALSRLVNNFPQSDYAHDARLRMLFLRDRLAKHQWNIIEYYQRKKAWVAVAARCKEILQDFGQTQYARPALIAMAEAYDKLGLTALAEDARRVAAENGVEVKN